MDINLLMKLFHLPSPSYQEILVQEFITKFLEERNIPFNIDDMGNIYNINNEGCVLMSAHMDTVQNDNDVKMARFAKPRGSIIKGNGCLGADDKNGLYIILNLLDSGWKDKINFVFSVEEEVGGNGSEHFVSENGEAISKLPYGLILDRRGANDIICINNDYGTKEFEDELVRLGWKFGYTPDIGTWSDADKISNYISCANLSVGYYNAHSRHEYVKIDELENASDYVKHIIDNIEGTFEKPNKYEFNSYSKYMGSFYPYDFDDYGNEIDPYATPSLAGNGVYKKCNCCYGMTSQTKFIKTLNMEICNTCYYSLIEELTDDYEDFFLESLIND
jgi:acetylornithine deacetylase/succinyl-diaminopimelate desuccinylase-like protein